MSTTPETEETEGLEGFKEFEGNLVEASKGALKFETLKYDLEKFTAEAKALSGNLSIIIESRKQLRIKRLSTHMNKINDAENHINSHLSEISNGLLDVMRRLPRDQQLVAFKTQMEQDMKWYFQGKGSRSMPRRSQSEITSNGGKGQRSQETLRCHL